MIYWDVSTPEDGSLSRDLHGRNLIHNLLVHTLTSGHLQIVTSVETKYWEKVAKNTVYEVSFLLKQ